MPGAAKGESDFKTSPADAYRGISTVLGGPALLSQLAIPSGAQRSNTGEYK
jgi:hypothetical protein